MAETDGVTRATGRTREEWFALLDAWGAAGRPYREIAGWLTGEHELSRWWAQKLVVEYEQARGVRAPGVRRDGTFEITASKTVAVPCGRLFDAFVDSRQRRRWLSDARMKLRGSQPGRTARFDWDDGASRVTVEFAAKGPAKSTVAVAHQRLGKATEAQAAKALWRERLNDLKSFLEASNASR
jgi:uncharacterized protein YndB with AHSA1/START domain